LKTDSGNLFKATHVGAAYEASFEREARGMAALSHPNILGIHDYGSEGPLPILFPPMACMPAI